MLGEVFLLGNWKNYEELEESLSMPELIQTFKSMQKTEEEKRKFLAMLQGVNLEQEKTEEKEKPETKKKKKTKAKAKARKPFFDFYGKKTRKNKKALY